MDNFSSLNTNRFFPLDLKCFADESKQVVDFISEYYKKIETYLVQSQVEPGYLKPLLPNTAPYNPEPLENILQDINDKILPGLTHWQSPNFFAYFQANASTAGFVGEMLCSGLNVVGFNWISSPAGTELETIVMDWMAEMLKLPSCFLFSGTGGGVLHTTTCESVICTLAAARDRALKKLGDDGNINNFVVYTSDQTHFTVQKAAKLVGIRPSNVRVIPTSSLTNFSLSPQSVRTAIEQDIEAGLVPLYICGTIGTTPSGTVDPLEELGKISEEFELLWFHIDAAYAGSACICPEYRNYMNGVELADSISMNPHKWFLTNLDCCCLWVKKPHLLIDSLSTKPEILNNVATESNEVVDYKDWQIALSRRFRAIKLWVVIRRYGLSQLMHHIRSDVRLAKHFEALVVEDPMFEIVVPSMFALVCFRLKPRADESDDATELNKKLLLAINSSGGAFMTHAMLGGVYAIRCAIGTTLTEEHHVDNLWKLVKNKASFILKS
ncbi:hypothetical protein ACFE04_013874 [Oxalis oulophora]